MQICLFFPYGPPTTYIYNRSPLGDNNEKILSNPSDFFSSLF